MSQYFKGAYPGPVPSYIYARLPVKRVIFRQFECYHQWDTFKSIFFLIVACPVGSFYHQEFSNCTLCSRGTYQDEEGQLSCKTCSKGKTTQGHGAGSSKECDVDKPDITSKDLCKPIGSSDLMCQLSLTRQGSIIFPRRSSLPFFHVIKMA